MSSKPCTKPCSSITGVIMWYTPYIIPQMEPRKYKPYNQVAQLKLLGSTKPRIIQLADYTNLRLGVRWQRRKLIEGSRITRRPTHVLNLYSKCRKRYFFVNYFHLITLRKFSTAMKKLLWWINKIDWQFRWYFYYNKGIF